MTHEFRTGNKVVFPSFPDFVLLVSKIVDSNFLECVCINEKFGTANNITIHHSLVIKYEKN